MRTARVSSVLDARYAGWAAWGLLAAALAALGWIWHLDRSRAWEQPSLAAPLVPLAFAPDTARETWLVAVNPDCPHCVTALARLRGRHPRDALVGALVVDTPRRPDAERVAAWRIAPVWWDAPGAWRRSWGHRVYGEVLCFDRNGRYLRTRSPE